MVEDFNKTLISYFLPEGILEYFEVGDIQSKNNEVTFFLVEKNHHPSEYRDDKLVSKGFFDEITVQDFPVRGKACYLKIRRRRWLNETTGKVVFRDWNLVAQGTRLTKEFASFLKAIARYPAS